VRSLVAWLAFALVTVPAQRQAELAHARALAEVVARQPGALQSGDRALAGQTLAALGPHGNVNAAVLYDRKGQPFRHLGAPAAPTSGWRPRCPGSMPPRCPP
jgi:hypothetical protein